MGPILPYPPFSFLGLADTAEDKANGDPLLLGAGEPSEMSTLGALKLKPRLELHQ